MNNIDAGFANIFYGELENYSHDWASDYLDAEEMPDEGDYKVYSTQDMLEAWAEAERIYNEES